MRGHELLLKPHVVAALRARGLEPPRGVHPATQIRKRRVKPIYRSKPTCRRNGARRLISTARDRTSIR
jgi:hypothetical protein